MADDSAKQRESRLLPGFWRLAEMQAAFFVGTFLSASMLVYVDWVARPERDSCSTGISVDRVDLRVGEIG